MNLNSENREQSIESNPTNPDLDFFTDEDREYFKSKDEEQNRLSKPPEDVKVYFPAVWVFEAFTPSFIYQLKKGLINTRLVDNIYLFNRRDILEELESMRSRTFGGSWFNAGHYSTHDSMSSRQIDLPEGINSVSIYLHQFVPSTTIMAVQFKFEESLNNTVEEVLRTDFRTYAKKLDKVTSFINPIKQKRKAYQSEIENLKSICTKWMSQNFPGLFESSLIGRGHPTAELILLENDSLFKKGGNDWESYLNTIGFRSEFETYRSEQLNGLYMALNEPIIAKRSSLTLSGNLNEILDEKESRGYGGENHISSICNWADLRLHKTLSFWCMSEIAYAFDHKIKRLRDQIGEIDSSELKQALSRLNKINEEISKLQMNALPFSKETAQSVNERHFKSEVYDFKLITEKIEQKLSLN